MRTFFSFILVFLSIAAFSQFSDDFSDGDFTNNPQWVGLADKFIINASNELQLYENPQAAGSSYLSTESGAIFNASWEFNVKFEFNPSSSNYCDVYLVANNSDLNSATQAYFVRVGNTSDEVSLYKKSNTSSTKIIDGIDGRLNTATVNVRIKVTRDLEGNWTLMSDTLGSNNYYTEGSVFDDTYYNFSHFGILCVYTSTRSQHMFFDNFVVSGEPFVDTEAPEILSLQVLDNQNIVLTFSESMDSASTLSSANYSVNNGINFPAACSFYESNTAKVLLEFNSSFVSGQNYTLFYENIRDENGNLISPGSIDFSYIEVSPQMVVINEIMADPDPPVFLPNAEYIELFNTSPYTINLEGWTYKIGSSSKTLSGGSIPPNGYIILCNANFVSDFETYGNTLGVESFPSITNSGQTITIYDNQNQLIDEVSYSNTWYGDSNKDDGGWSLEKIDPLNTCAPHTNWKASNDERGGTPGEINSIYGPNQDLYPPYVLSVEISSANELRIVFSEPVDSSSAIDYSNYFVNNDFGNPFYAIFENNENNIVLLQFPISFAENTVYTISISNIKDNCGNIMLPSEHNFIKYNPKEFDIIITEIMADPEPSAGLPEAEYIEIYNRTPYPLNLNNWEISVGSTTKTISNCSINPGQYIAFTKNDYLSLFSDYENFIGIESFPSLSNSGTTLVLRDNNHKIIHTITYSDTWYKDNFKKNGGYSLEMIDLNNPCEGIENWKAALNAGTPGVQNSVYGENPDVTHPYPVAADPVASDSLIVYFNEPLLLNTITETNFFVEGIGNPISIFAQEPDYSVVSLKFSSNFVPGNLYYVNVSQDITDCTGNNIPQSTSFRFGLADSVKQNDVVINEILFNPFSSSNDFVELYNKSEKMIDLKHLWISNKDDAGEIKDSYNITTISHLLLPDEYVAISVDINELKNNYYIPYPENLYQVENLPSMPDDYGTILITDRVFNAIDEVSYNKNMHYKLLASQDGVSLERINPERASDDPTNWHSASQTVGFATPGYKNSQYSDNIVSESTITLTPKVFSPDNDGFDDVLNISYSLDQPGYTATIAIYDADGRFITYIINNTLLEKEGNLIWDGFDNNNTICNPGIYILYVEMFNLNGNKIAEKHSIVLSRKK